MIVEHRIKVTDSVYLTLLQVDGVTWIETDEFTGVYYDSVDKVLRTFPVPVFGRETFMPVKRLENQITRPECTVLSYVSKQEENGDIVLSVTFREKDKK